MSSEVKRYSVRGQFDQGLDLTTTRAVVLAEDYAALEVEVQRLREQWVPASEHLPESERTVLAFYQNSLGNGRRVRAEYIAAKTKSADDGWDSDSPADYDEQADEYFWPAGWYEVIDNWCELTHVAIHEGEVTHWMPLPAAPALAASTGQEVEK